MELQKLTFDLSSEEDIRKKSCYELTNVKISENKTNTVYDKKGGSIFNSVCATCNQKEQLCPGHFGHIELNAVIVHPLFVNHVLNVLKLLCHNCNDLLLSKDRLKLEGCLKLSGEKRFYDICNKFKKVGNCFNCNTSKRDYKIKKSDFYNTIIYDDDKEITDIEIYYILSQITPENIELLGISNPKNCCLKVFPVIPYCCRPSEITGSNIKEDDLTRQLIEILKANKAIVNSNNKYFAINNLKSKIEAFCRNPKNKIRNGNTNDPIKGIRERLTGKDGQLRDNLMGKRTEMSGRTVIGPGPTLKLDEVGIPETMANALSFPIPVYENNFQQMLDLINNNKVNTIIRDGNTVRIYHQIYSKIMEFLNINDIIIRDGKSINVSNTMFDLIEGDKIFRNGLDITPDILPKKLDPYLQIGDIVQRKLKDGDWILMNRQPTLWKGSMMAFKCKIFKNIKTFTFNLAVCKAFNADFDGDEQNAHIPQSLESSIELKLLSSPEECLMNSSNGTPVIVILQDNLLGAYLMSKSDDEIPLSMYNDILMNLCLDVDYYLNRKNQIKKTLLENNMPVKLRNGKSLLSLLFPDDFNFSYENSIKIVDGVLLEGVLDKRFLGSTKNSILIYLNTEYGSSECVRFINDIQFMTNHWLTYNSFSINIEDCRQFDVTNLVYKNLREADMIKKTILNKNLLEAETNMILSNAGGVGRSISLTDTNENNIIKTIASGSKGDYFNLGQVRGLLGQQIINGRRVSKTVDNCSRTLIHYKKSDLSLKDEYESRGFIMSSFAKGLNPKEFFFHSMSGRQGVCDTAMTTFMSGYNMRKLIKLTEDIKIQNDGTVADSSGSLYSYAYGDNGYCTDKLPMKMNRVLERLNKKYSK